MGILKRQIQLYILLMAFWLILNSAVSLRLVISGSFISIMIIRMTKNVLFDEDNTLLHLPAVWRFIWFSYIVLVSMIKASLMHIVRIFKNENQYVHFEVKMRTENIIINTLVANAITLTPGTITLSLEADMLKVVGFSNSESDIEAMIVEIRKYEKPFLYRRE